MGDRRNFRGGGGANPKKDHGEKSAERPPHGEKCPHNEKNVAKRAPYGEKVAKISGVARGGGGGGRQNSAQIKKKLYMENFFKIWKNKMKM